MEPHRKRHKRTKPIQPSTIQYSYPQLADTTRPQLSLVSVEIIIVLYIYIYKICIFISMHTKQPSSIVKPKNLHTPIFDISETVLKFIQSLNQKSLFVLASIRPPLPKFILPRGSVRVAKFQSCYFLMRDFTATWLPPLASICQPGFREVLLAQVQISPQPSYSAAILDPPHSLDPPYIQAAIQAANQAANLAANQATSSQAIQAVQAAWAEAPPAAPAPLGLSKYPI